MVYWTFILAAYAGRMDLGFARRRNRKKIQPRAALDALLATASARQAITPTARAQAQLPDIAETRADDPRIALFGAGDIADTRERQITCFGAIGEPVVNPRQ